MKYFQYISRRIAADTAIFALNVLAASTLDSEIRNRVVGYGLFLFFGMLAYGFLRRKKDPSQFAPPDFTYPPSMLFINELPVVTSSLIALAALGAGDHFPAQRFLLALPAAYIGRNLPRLIVELERARS